MKTFSLAVAAAVGMLATQAHSATTLLLDPFTEFQLVADRPGPGRTNASQVSGSDIIGGFRDLRVTNTVSDDPTDDNDTVVRIRQGRMTFNNTAGSRGTATLTYDGNDDATSFDPTGLGGMDFLIGDAPRFQIDLAASDLNVYVQITVTDMDRRESIFEVTRGPGATGGADFALFNGDADFSNVGGLQIFVSSEPTDDSVDSIFVGPLVVAANLPPVPLPASGMLLLAGLGAMAALRRRKG